MTCKTGTWLSFYLTYNRSKHKIIALSGEPQEIGIPKEVEEHPWRGTIANSKAGKHGMSPEHLPPKRADVSAKFGTMIVEPGKMHTNGSSKRWGSEFPEWVKQCDQATTLVGVIEAIKTRLTVLTRYGEWVSARPVDSPLGIAQKTLMAMLFPEKMDTTPFKGETFYELFLFQNYALTPNDDKIEITTWNGALIVSREFTRICKSGERDPHCTLCAMVTPTGVLFVGERYPRVPEAFNTLPMKSGVLITNQDGPHHDTQPSIYVGNFCEGAHLPAITKSIEVRPANRNPMLVLPGPEIKKSTLWEYITLEDMKEHNEDCGEKSFTLAFINWELHGRNILRNGEKTPMRWEKDLMISIRASMFAIATIGLPKIEMCTAPPPPITGNFVDYREYQEGVQTAHADQWFYAGPVNNLFANKLMFDIPIPKAGMCGKLHCCKTKKCHLVRILRTVVPPFREALRRNGGGPQKFCITLTYKDLETEEIRTIKLIHPISADALSKYDDGDMTFWTGKGYDPDLIAEVHRGHLSKGEVNRRQGEFGLRDKELDVEHVRENLAARWMITKRQIQNWWRSVVAKITGSDQRAYLTGEWSRLYTNTDPHVDEAPERDREE